jgi:hypothetical protein
MDTLPWMWLLFVVIGLFSMARPGTINLFQRRGTLARMSDYYETPERKRLALKLERFDRWFFTLNGACMVLAGLSLRFVSENVFMGFFALSGLLALMSMVYTARVFSSKS